MLFFLIKAIRNQWCFFIHVYSRPIFTFEIYLPSERAFLFGAETPQAQRKWTEAIAKVFKYCIVIPNPEKILNLGSMVEFQRSMKILYKILGRMSIFH